MDWQLSAYRFRVVILYARARGMQTNEMGAVENPRPFHRKWPLPPNVFTTPHGERGHPPHRNDIPPRQMPNGKKVINSPLTVT